MYFGSSNPILSILKSSGNFLLIGYLWHSWTAVSTANAVDSSTLGNLEKLSSSATPSLTKSRRLKRPFPLILVPPISNLVTSEPNDRRKSTKLLKPPSPGSESSSVTSGLSVRSKWILRFSVPSALRNCSSSWMFERKDWFVTLLPDTVAGSQTVPSRSPSRSSESSWVQNCAMFCFLLSSWHCALC